jgi:hypothetical protein
MRQGQRTWFCRRPEPAQCRPGQEQWGNLAWRYCCRKTAGAEADFQRPSLALRRSQGAECPRARTGQASRSGGRGTRLSAGRAASIRAAPIRAQKSNYLPACGGARRHQSCRRRPAFEGSWHDAQLGRTHCAIQALLDQAGPARSRRAVKPGLRPHQRLHRCPSPTAMTSSHPSGTKRGLMKCASSVLSMT